MKTKKCPRCETGDIKYGTSKICSLCWRCNNNSCSLMGCDNIINSSIEKYIKYFKEKNKI
jgi:hypothetical protein